MLLMQRTGLYLSRKFMYNARAHVRLKVKCIRTATGFDRINSGRKKNIKKKKKNWYLLNNT